MRMKPALLLTTLLLGPGVASAIPVSWSYTGTCTSGACSTVPGVTGFLTGDPGDVFPGNFNLAASEISYFSFAFGSYVFETGDGTSTVSSLLGLTFDSDRNVILGSLTFSNRTGLFDFDFEQGSAGEILGWSFTDRTGTTRITASGPGGYTAVPEPGSLALLGGGLLAMGLMRRRRKSS